MNYYVLQDFIKQLKTHRHLLDKQTIKTLRGQALNGNLDGAKKGLATALKKANVMDMAHRQTKVISKYHEVDYKGQFNISLKESHKAKTSTH